MHQDEGVPNCDNSSAVTLFNSKVYAFDHYNNQLWEFSNYQWNKANFLKVSPKELDLEERENERINNEIINNEIIK